jgi:acyl dehydratase
MATDQIEAVLQAFREGPVWEKGHYYEDFTVGQVMEHHWGRTITEADNTLFTTLTLHFNPLYFNDEYARRLGHGARLLNPYLLFSVVFGLTVEDLSERGGAFLGVDDLVFARPAHAGETVRASSTVKSMRPSGKDPAFGIVSWDTIGFDAAENVLLSFTRTNLVKRRPAP